MSASPETADWVRVSPGSPRACWEVRVPGSKSLTNRALLLAGLAAGRSTLRDPLIADDTEAMAAALSALGATISRADGAWAVDGLDGAPRGDTRLWCSMAGTVARFLLPALAAGEGRFEVDGHPQLRRRPLGPLLDALRAQGATVDGDALPVTLTATGLAGGNVRVDGSVSSQFLSGLAMAAPLARAPTRLRFGSLVSAPYLRLTLDAMAVFGVAARVVHSEIEVMPAGYRAADYAVEPDASTASYFLASAALTGTTVSVPGLALAGTLQGDARLAGLLERMGCSGGETSLSGPARLRGIDAEMGELSDVSMTLACVAPFAEGPTTIEGIGHARVKESDRIAATAENLNRLGVRVDQGADHLRIHPGPVRSARLPAYDDHRIAMAFALAGARVPVEIEDPGVVAKTCPAFWELWPATGARVELGDGPMASDALGARG
ncbi:MAG: 3-phosphoshikimate 1-carboxyvinyltransferase [Solirubrobacteraceae bacterium]